MPKLNFTQYLHDLAVKAKYIGHIDDDPDNRRFFCASSINNLEEIIQNLPEFKGFALAVEDNQEGNYNMNGSATLFDKQLCGFFILSKANNLDAIDRGVKIRSCEAILRKVIAYIKKDYFTDNANKTNIGLRNIDWDSLNYFSFGPVLDNCYGVFCAFVNPTVQNTVYDTNDYNEQ
jgi:hypothetical protein